MSGFAWLGRAVNRLKGRRVVAPALLAEAGVAARPDGSFVAENAEPWLRVDLDGLAVGGRWIRLDLSTNLSSHPVRPLLRFEGGGEHRPAILPAPVLGTTIWAGPVPAGVTGLAISPVAEPGPFAAAIGEIRLVSRPLLLFVAFGRRPVVTLDAVKARVLRLRVRSRRLLGIAWNAARPGDYGRWAARRSGGLPEPAGAGLVAVLGSVVIRVDTGGAGMAAVERTLASLRQAEPFSPRAVLATGAVLGPPPAETGWIGWIRAGDSVDPGAFAALAAAARRRPDAVLLTSDEDRLSPDGRRSHPVLSPEPSPRLQEAAPRWPGLVLVRGDVAHRVATPTTPRLAVLRAVAAEGNTAHVRRVLLHRSGPTSALPAAPAAPAPAERPLVSVVIPNRDRAALLRVCLDGLMSRTAYGPLEIVVVDNGSVAPDALGLYRDAATDPRVTILEQPGPFNFSALTNAGVAASTGPLVLLLNNDIEVIRPDWLDLMVAEAVRPGVGAVGARLLYPGGRVQHDGVMIGLGGEAGHPYRGRWLSRPDLLGRGDVPHEVSAVTGACLLVGREAYHGVGGLDEELFPVSFNDIDLCLKLGAAGLRNIQVPAAILKHHESASRGRDTGAKQARAEREARAFAAKWLPVMRDDPYFHPAVSLARFNLSLG